MAQLNLESGSAGKRLGAKLVDGILPALITGAAALIGMPLIGYEQVSASSAVLDLSMFFVVTGAGTLLALGYWIFLWGWEARTGKTPGNLAFGIRTTNEDGFAPGWLAVFLRNLIIGLSGIVPVIGFVIVMISNLFDPNGKRQGWYDKAARTFVFDVRRGRNPLVTGGINGPASFAPQAPLPAVQPISSPVVFSPEKVPTGSTAPLPDVETTHPDAEAGETIASRRRTAATAYAPAGVRIRLDDGRDLVLQSEALIGRNPSAKASEAVQLIPVQDDGRSVSKTHLHLRVEAGRLWVTDRHSTNGSAITGDGGERTTLPGGQPYWAAPGSTVHFGDRSFRVEQA